jgi:DNA-binding transcriptional LysR family regulator
MEIELKLLRCALTLAEFGNFARGAKALNMSQPSLSRNIQELERQLGAALFVRSPRGVEPTVAGIVLLKHARKVIDQSESLVREMSLTRGLEQSELTVGVDAYPGQMFVGRAIGRLVHDHPAARISIIHDGTCQSLPHLLKREFDLAVIYLPARPNAQLDTRLDVTPLSPHPIFFAVRSGHPLVRPGPAPGRRGTPVSLPEILKYPTCTAGRMPPEMTQRFRKASEPSARLKSIPSISCESLAMMKSIVAESDAVALLPLNVVSAAVEEGAMTILPVLEPWMLATYGIARPRHRNLPMLGKKLIQAITDADAELAEYERQNTAPLLSKSGWSKKTSQQLSTAIRIETV